MSSKNEDDKYSSELLCSSPTSSQSEVNYSEELFLPAIKRRKRFSPDETKVLEREYKANSSPNQQKIQAIANSIFAPRKTVTTWFQNRRAKNKRKVKVETTKEEDDMLLGNFSSPKNISVKVDKSNIKEITDFGKRDDDGNSTYGLSFTSPTANLSSSNREFNSENCFLSVYENEYQNHPYKDMKSPPFSSNDDQQTTSQHYDIQNCNMGYESFLDSSQFSIQQDGLPNTDSIANMQINSDYVSYIYNNSHFNHALSENLVNYNLDDIIFPSELSGTELHVNNDNLLLYIDPTEVYSESEKDRTDFINSK